MNLRGSRETWTRLEGGNDIHTAQVYEILQNKFNFTTVVS